MENWRRRHRHVSVDVVPELGHPVFFENEFAGAHERSLLLPAFYLSCGMTCLANNSRKLSAVSIEQSARQEGHRL
jgi:hypothetical protein